MKIIHQSGYSNEELLEYKPVVYRNLIECAQDLVRGATLFVLPLIWFPDAVDIGAEVQQSWHKAFVMLAK